MRNLIVLPLLVETRWPYVRGDIFQRKHRSVVDNKVEPSWDTKVPGFVPKVQGKGSAQLGRHPFLFHLFLVRVNGVRKFQRFRAKNDERRVTRRDAPGVLSKQTTRTHKKNCRHDEQRFRVGRFK